MPGPMHTEAAALLALPCCGFLSNSIINLSGHLQNSENDSLDHLLGEEAILYSPLLYLTSPHPSQQKASQLGMTLQNVFTFICK